MAQIGKSRMIVESNSESGTSDEIERQSPSDFNLFLPWACLQLNVDAYLELTKGHQAANTTVEGAKRKHKQKKNIMSDSAKSVLSTHDMYLKSLPDYEYKVVRIVTNYIGEKLVQIKIDKTRRLPREILSIINLTIQFYPYLTSLYVNSGANKYTIYEMCKFLPFSNITEINLDSTFIKEGTYYTILDHAKHLQILSLSRCSLNDQVIEKIASKLVPPLWCSKTLSVLNLSINRLTNVSAKFLAKMLRTNRHLVYLNVAGNMITDEGMSVILNTLQKFTLTIEEKFMIKGNYINYLRRRQALIDGHLKILRKTDPKNRPWKKTSVFVKKTSTEKIRNLTPTSPNTNHFYEKAVRLANSECGEFDDPFEQDTFCVDGTIYSNGNHTLAYLNIAYNSISHLSVKLLLEVLKHQRILIKTPKGLVNVSLEGNPIPENTAEIFEIECLLRMRILKEKFTAGSAKRKSAASISAVSTKETRPHRSPRD